MDHPKTDKRKRADSVSEYISRDEGQSVPDNKRPRVIPNEHVEQLKEAMRHYEHEDYESDEVIEDQQRIRELIEQVLMYEQLGVEETQETLFQLCDVLKYATSDATQAVTRECVQALLKLILAEDSKIVEYSAGCLLWVSKQQETANFIVTGGGIKVLLHSMQSKYNKTQEYSTRALGMISAFEEHALEVLKEGGIEAFLNAVKSSELDIQKCGCGGLVNLATTGKYEIINAILNKDGVQAFSSLADSTDSEMQRYACYGLASMTLTEDDAHIQPLLDLGVIQKLMKFIDSSDLATKQSVCRGLAHLSANSRSYLIMIKEGCLSPLVSLLSHKDNVIQKDCTFAVTRLMFGSIEENKGNEVIQQVIDHGVLESLVKFSGSQYWQIRELAALGLYYIIEADRKFHPLLSSKNGIEALCKLIPDNPSIVAKAFTELAEKEEYANKIAAHPTAIAAIIKHVPMHDLAPFLDTLNRQKNTISFVIAMSETGYYPEITVSAIFLSPEASEFTDSQKHQLTRLITGYNKLTSRHELSHLLMTLFYMTHYATTRAQTPAPTSTTSTYLLRPSILSFPLQIEIPTNSKTPISNTIFPDVQLTVSDVVIPGHKCHLIAYSGYFTSLFKAQDTPDTAYAVPDVDPGILTKIVQSCYHPSITVSSPMEFYKVLEAADRLQMAALRQHCLQLLPKIGLQDANNFQTTTEEVEWILRSYFKFPEGGNKETLDWIVNNWYWFEDERSEILLPYLKHFGNFWKVK